jgi:hypothetical protein
VSAPKPAPDVVIAVISRDVHKPCDCRVFADTCQLVLCAQHPGCQRCKRGGWDGVILADSEDWRVPVCVDCYDEVGGDPEWDAQREAGR